MRTDHFLVRLENVLSLKMLKIAKHLCSQHARFLLPFCHSNVFLPTLSVCLKPQKGKKIQKFPHAGNSPEQFKNVHFWNFRILSRFLFLPFDPFPLFRSWRGTPSCKCSSTVETSFRPPTRRFVRITFCQYNLSPTENHPPGHIFLWHHSSLCVGVF